MLFNREIKVYKNIVEEKFYDMETVVSELDFEELGQLAVSFVVDLAKVEVELESKGKPYATVADCIVRLSDLTVSRDRDEMFRCLQSIVACLRTSREMLTACEEEGVQ